MDEQTFLKIIEEKKFIDSEDIQQKIHNYVFNTDVAIFYLLLWQIAENHPESNFSTSLIANEFLRYATIDEILDALECMQSCPVVTFTEAVFSKGTIEQIKRFESIRNKWIEAYLKSQNTTSVNKKREAAE